MSTTEYERLVNLAIYGPLATADFNDAAELTVFPVIIAKALPLL